MNTSITFVQAQLSDIDSVLDLQELYLVTNLSETERAAGFVTTPFTVEQLKTVIAKKELFLAKEGKRVVGYIFAGSWQFYQQWPIFAYMSSLITQLNFANKNVDLQNSFQYGPICIHKKYRGTGIIKPLFELMRSEMVQKYPLALTFINKANQPSTKAHTEKLNWSIISEFEYNTNSYYILAYDMQNELK
ncbi:GNAT family acetyltransferase [Flavobacterium sp. GNP001]